LQLTSLLELLGQIRAFGKIIAKGHEETDINNGDLDPGRDFEITIAASGKKGSL
jgi:hypothetical protein